MSSNDHIDTNQIDTNKKNIPIELLELDIC